MIVRAGSKPETREAPSQSCWAVTPETLAAAPSGGLAPEELCEIIDQAIHEEAMDAGRVKLNAGEAVCIDNYRCLHAREAFWGERERRLWRIWTWTSSGDVRAPSDRFVNTCCYAGAECGGPALQGRPDGDSAVSTPLDIHLENTGGLESTAGLKNA